MTTALARPARSDQVSVAQATVLAMWRAQPGALMLLGRSSGVLPKGGSARVVTRAGTPGVFRAEFWPVHGESGYAFLAAIRLPHVADRADDAELILRGARGTDLDLRLALVAACSELDFGKQVAASAGAHAALLTRFMLDVMRSENGSDMRQPGAVLDAFLTHAARPDGCVELIMYVPQKCVLLQGWGIQPTEPVELLLPGSSMLRRLAMVGAFSRSDVAAPATGNVLVLPPELAGAMMSLEKVFLLSGDDLLCRYVVEQHVLDVDASIGQIRHLLPRLHCPAPMQALLRATLQPQYDGRDTLNASGRPIRAALDIAVAAMGGGAYLSGWLFDPACHLAELHVCAEGFAMRLDKSWVRVPRDDVSAAFRADPAFPLPNNQESGFAVGIPAAPPPGKPAYLRLTFTDAEVAFVPIRFVDSGVPAAVNALVASVDLHKSSGAAIIAQHLAPFIAQMPKSHENFGQILLHGPLERQLAVVVPLRTASLPRSLISSFLLDPATDDEQIVFVCGPEWNRTQCEDLVSLIRFYELPASIVGVPQSPLSADAIREVATLSQADSFLLASPGVVGRVPGWRGLLHRAARADQVACPTVLYEDRSLRFAGSAKVEFLDRAPFVSITTPFAGACADLASDEEPTQIAGGTFACCLIRRSALPALERATTFMTEAGQEAAFFLSLGNAGMNGIWVSSVRVSAPENDEAPATPALPLIDGWMLRHTWGEPPQCAY